MADAFHSSQFFLRLKARYSCGMNLGALRALEFDRVTAALRSFALTPLGAARLDALSPLSDARRVQDALQTTTEAVRYLESQPPFPLRAPDDLEDLLAALRIDGRFLEPTRLLALAVSSSRSSRREGRFAGRQARSRACAASSSPWPLSQMRSATCVERSATPATCLITPARRCRDCGTGFGNSGHGFAARSSRTCEGATPRSICRSRSSRSATGAS